MSTWQYIWRPSSGEDRHGWVLRAREEVSRRLRDLHPSELWLHLTEELPPRMSLVPFRRGALGLVTVQGKADDLGKRALDSLTSLGGRWAGYLVAEAQPIPRALPDSKDSRSPGVCLLTLFRRKRGLTREQFLTRWHGGHTPLSLDIHPFQSYVRCTVQEPIFPGSPPWEGIVTESCATRGDLLNPLRLFGGPSRALFNMVRVGRDIYSFMDIWSMESYLVGEYAL